MKIRRTLATIATGAMALSLIAAHEGVETNDFVMNGANEVLEVGGPDDKDDTSYKGDRRGQARAHVSIPDDDGTAICLHLELTKDLSDEAGALTGLHIHLGGRNEAGPVTVQLSSLVGELAETGEIDSCIDNPTDAAGNPVSGPTLADIVLQGRERFTNEYYLNLHSENFPAGALRGQIRGENYRPIENGNKNR